MPKKGRRKCYRNDGRRFSYFTITLWQGNLESPRIPCFVREQLHEMIGHDDYMRVFTPEGYLYKIKLDIEPEITTITGDDWEDFVHHYSLQIDQTITVEFDMADFIGPDFFRILAIQGERYSPRNFINEPEVQVNFIKYPLAVESHESILKGLWKPPSMTLSVEQIKTVVSFARQHFDRIGRIVVHKITENNLRSKTLKLSSEFIVEVDIPSSGKICLKHHPEIMESSAWSEDHLGRFVLEKQSWNTLADKCGFRNGSVVQFCFTRKRGCFIDMQFCKLD